MRYLVIIEKSDTGYAAHSPDLEGCVATGPTIDEVEATMREAVEFHIDKSPPSAARTSPAPRRSSPRRAAPRCR